MALTFLIVFLCLTNVSANDINDTIVYDSSIEVNLLSANSNINVTLTASDEVGYYNFEKSLNVHVIDVNGNAINYGNVTFHDVFGKDYTVKVKEVMQTLITLL